MADTARPAWLSSLPALVVLAFVVGVVTGFGALLFRWLIGFIHNLLFYGEVTGAFEPESLMPLSPWGVLVIFVPVVGGLGVVWLTETFAPEARGHGVPEVMDAIYYREGRIRPVVAIAKSLASALSIGSGASVGREGPIIQIGSSFGSTISQLVRLPTWQRITLIGSGAGAGIAATFNTPLGGVMFAIELMLPEVSTRTFLPVVIATATATYIGRIFLGLEPAFDVPIPELESFQAIEVADLTGFVVLGVLCGLTSVAFVRLLTLSETWFQRYLGNPYLRHTVGMLAVGLMIYGLAAMFGHYFVAGTGYGTISAVLGNELMGFQLLAILFFAKLLATVLSLGSGGSGGIFSPSLFLGATLGGALAYGLNLAFPGTELAPPEFAMVGMAGLVGGATGAAMTAIVMVFEMTRDYHIMVPMVIAVALAIGVRRRLSVQNIYTQKLAQRGHHIPQTRHANMFLVRHAHEIMDEAYAVLPGEMTLEAALEHLSFTEKHFIVVADGDTVLGILPLNWVLDASDGVETEARLVDLASPAWVSAERDDIVEDIIRRLRAQDARYAVVVPNATAPKASNVIGVLGKRSIADSVIDYFYA